MAARVRHRGTVPSSNLSLRRSVSMIKENALTKLWSRTPAVSTPIGNSKPNFIIKWGPPASGKTVSLSAVISSLGQNKNSYINFSVDDPVEASNYFKRESLRLANNYLTGTNKTENAIVSKLNKIINKNVKPFANVYSRVRLAGNNNGRSFGNKLDIMLDDAIKARRNITFETTGSSRSVSNIPAWPGWIFAKHPNLASIYNVILVFPLVPFETTWDRYRRRATKMYLARNGFRFAATKKQLFNSYLTSYVNFTRNLNSAAKMSRIKKVIVVPHKGEPKEWTPGATRQGLRTRNRQTILDLVNKYIEHMTNNNFNL